MQHLRNVKLTGTDEIYQLMITDEQEALSEAKAAGRAVVAIKLPDSEAGYLWGSDFLVEAEAVTELDEDYLERVVRRHLGLPWIIAETERTMIKEMEADEVEEIYQMYGNHDFPLAVAPLSADLEAEIIKFKAYQKNMYQFFGYGIWGVYEKATDTLIGRAGYENFYYQDDWVPELCFQMKPRWRGQGFCEEALMAILAYGGQELQFEQVYARVHQKNIPSKTLLEKLKFQFLEAYLEGDEKVFIQIRTIGR